MARCLRVSSECSATSRHEPPCSAAPRPCAFETMSPTMLRRPVLTLQPTTSRPGGLRSGQAPVCQRSDQLRAPKALSRVGPREALQVASGLLTARRRCASARWAAITKRLLSICDSKRLKSGTPLEITTSRRVPEVLQFVLHGRRRQEDVCVRASAREWRPGDAGGTWRFRIRWASSAIRNVDRRLRVL